MRDVSLKVQDYKCFGREPQGFEGIWPINILIGRNNSGKSSLLDCFGLVTGAIRELPGDGHHRGGESRVYLTLTLDDRARKQAFRDDRRTISDRSTVRSDWHYSGRWRNARVTYSLQGLQFVSMDPELEAPIEHYSFDAIESDLVRAVGNPFKGRVFKRLQPNRDVWPEHDHNPSSSIIVSDQGVGATALIQRFINHHDLPRQLVEETLRKDLNNILGPDAHFTALEVQLIGEQWEVFLVEKLKGSIRLSQSGSGLKTVLLVLVFIHLVPVIEEEQLDRYIFAFEELENNLHPALQRRLLAYLRAKAEPDGPFFFLTTHSSTFVNHFAGADDAQILHVRHNQKEAQVSRVGLYHEQVGILDDIGVRASDILQSNGVIWVEGPSDRIYLNRWIELMSGGELTEGLSYQILFYGGAVLKHFTGKAPSETLSDFVQLLRTSRNCAILMDSDRKKKGGRLNQAKHRVRSEVTTSGGYCWVTAGREIENYLSADAVAAVTGTRMSPQIGQYEEVETYLKRLSPRPRFGGKPEFARRLAPKIKESDLNVLDLRKRVSQLCGLIQRWNELEDNVNG